MKYAIVTPSYGPDFERCQLLSQSIDAHVSGEFHHHVIVDARDVPLFRQLEGPRTTVTSVESVMPWWLRRMPMSRRWWMNFKGKPVRNWILQQLVKLSVSDFIDAESYVFVDSDVAFVRPFDVSSLETEGLLRLFRVPGAANQPTHRPWHRTSASLLGLPSTDYFGSTYIGNLITWRRDNLQKMHRHIESVTGRPWLQAVSSHWHLSEYILYGIFVEHVLGEKSNQVFTDIPLCHISWNYNLESDADIARFFDELWPEHVAVMMSSKQYIPPARYQHLVETPAFAY